MYQFLTGMFLTDLFVGGNNNEEEVSIENININQLETILRDAKLVQQPKKYLVTQEIADEVASPAGFGINQDVLDVINDMIDDARITVDELKIIRKELKKYKK